MHSELGVAVRRRMREARDAANFTQADVATELGVSRQVVTKWEAGGSSPNYVQIVKMCAFYGVTTDALLLGMDTVPADAQKALKGARLPPKDFADSG